jgi:hypothetical protein
MEPRLPRYRDQPAEIMNKLRQQLRTSGRVFRGSQFLVGAVLPLAEAILVNLLTGGDDGARVGLTSFLVVVIILHLALLSLVLSVDVPLPQFLVQFDEQAHELQRLRALADTYEADYTTPP